KEAKDPPKKDPPKQDPPKKDGKTSGSSKDDGPKGDDRTLIGTIVFRDQNSIKLLAKDGKEYHIFKTATVRPTINDEAKKYFEDLREGDTATVTYDRGMYFNDPFTLDQQKAYTRNPQVYLSQIAPVYMQVDPVDERGQGTVQLRGWPLQRD